MIADVFGDQTDYQHLLKMRFPSDETSNSSPVHGSVSTKTRLSPLQQAANSRILHSMGDAMFARLSSVCALSSASPNGRMAPVNQRSRRGHGEKLVRAAAALMEPCSHHVIGPRVDVDLSPVPHAAQVTSSPRTPSERILPCVMGLVGASSRTMANG